MFQESASHKIVNIIGFNQIFHTFLHIIQWCYSLCVKKVDIGVFKKYIIRSGL